MVKDGRFDGFAPCSESQQHTVFEMNSGRIIMPTNSKKFTCIQCGNCCLNLGDAFQTSVSDEDIAMWRTKGRFDILEWVHPIPLGEGHYIYDIWISPKTGDDVSRCPWLRKVPKQDKYICRIHDVKPEHCRKYPKSRTHAEETGCKGFESICP